MNGYDVDEPIKIKVSHGQAITAIKRHLSCDGIINEVLAPTDVFAVAALSLREGVIYCEILGGEIARQT